LGRWHAAREEELALVHRTEDPELIARALCGAGLDFGQEPHNEPSPARLRESLQIAREHHYPAVAKWARFHLARLEPLKQRQRLLEELLASAPHGAIDLYLGRDLGWIAASLGDLEGAEARLRISAEGFGEWGMVGEQAQTYIHVAALRGDYARAARLLEQRRELCRRSGLVTSLAYVVNTMGTLAWQCEDHEAAACHFAESLALAREYEIEGHEARCLIGLARVACERGEYERAETICAQVPDRVDDVLHDGGEYVHLPSALARVALCRGQAARAVELCREEVDFQHREAGRPDLVEALEPLAWALVADGQHDLGTRLLACAAREREEMGFVRYPVDRPYQERALDAARAGLGAAAFDAAWAKGEALSLEEAIEMAKETSHQ
jgi:tetratricopeptide (TPR) repeat protein